MEPKEVLKARAGMSIFQLFAARLYGKYREYWAKLWNIDKNSSKLKKAFCDIKYDGKKYKIKVCAVGKKEKDLALAKINILGECKPIKYRFYNENKFERIPVTSITRKNGKVIRDHGFLSFNGVIIVFTIDTEKGDSEGVVTSIDERIIGINYAGFKDEKYITFAVRLFNALELIDVYKRHIQRKII